MNFLKRFVSGVISAVVLMSALAVPGAAAETALAEPYSLTGEELITRIGETYDDARALAGRRSFAGKCSTMVNCSALALGIITERPARDGHGRDAYDRYSVMERSTGGYEAVPYSAAEYDLEGALNAVCENGTRDVYNLIVGFCNGGYGHALFVHGIVDGMVYFSESYGLRLAGKYYREGEPIVCTVAEFAEYYNKWARFEGLVHMDFPDETAPAMSRLVVVSSSEEGFTLRCRAADNMGIVEMYAKVWPFGSSEEEAVTVPVSNGNGAVVIRINTEQFGGFVGRYYVNLYAADRKGNVSVVGLEEQGISLYQPQEHQGTYRTRGRNIGVYSAPYTQVNGTVTREAAIPGDTLVDVTGCYVNEAGETWYQLPDGGWIQAERTRREITCWADLWELVIQELRGSEV